MEKFTTYKVLPIEGWGTSAYTVPDVEHMKSMVHGILYDRVKSVKVTALFAHQSKYLPVREALIALFEVKNQDTWKYGDPVEVVQHGATMEELEEVSKYVDGVPRDFYDRHPLWD